MYTKPTKVAGFPFSLDDGLSINQEPLNKGGRPTVVKNNAKTRKQIRYLASLGVSQKCAAEFLGVSRQAFLNAFKRNPDLRVAWDSGLAVGNINLRAKQYQRAMAGNTRMLIWLGKQRLGQTDNPQNAQSQPKLPSEMTDNELRDFVYRLKQSIAASADRSKEHVKF
jgi:hypothetical protein